MGQELSTEGSTEFSLETPNGIFKGITIRDRKTGAALCHRFTGVRYALPITKRWTKSERVPDDYDYSLKEYKEFSKPCPQPSESGLLSFISTDGPYDEDCAYVNIWVPASADLTKAELPVFFYIHGGWLQYGAANQVSMYDPRTLQSWFDKSFVIVSPAYRLNSIGFLGTKNLKDEGFNFGFWDQRLALEWTSRFIKYFGGNNNKITVGGLSAGSYSTFFQLAYEIYHPEAPQLIKQVVHFSNCLIVQPKKLEEVESQFEEYVEVLGIDSDLSGPAKIEALRDLDSSVLEEALLKMKMHTFRAITDDQFVSSSLLKDIYSGDYGLKLQKKNIRILMGEVDNELEMYSYLNTPKTRVELPLQLENYYPKAIIPSLLEIYDKSTNSEELRISFGTALADSQIYASTRGFLHNSLKKCPELSKRIFRYKISYVPKYIREQLDAHNIKGIIHSNDQSIWFFPNIDLLSESEQRIIENFLIQYIDFIHMEHIDWGTDKITQHKFLNSQGEIKIEDDEAWDRYIAISEKLYQAQL